MPQKLPCPLFNRTQTRDGIQAMSLCSSLRLVVQSPGYSLYCLCKCTGSTAFLRMRMLSISTMTEKAIAK